jgi:hypothetical protein
LTFDRPEMLVGLAALPLLYLLERLRARRVVVTVSSILPWESLPPSDRVREPVRPPVLRFLLLSVAWTLLVGALARPVIRGDAPGRLVAVLVDRSASMGAAHGAGGSRLDEARRRIDALLARLDASDRVLVRTEPESGKPPVAGREGARRLLAALSPSDRPGGLGAVLTSVRAEAREAGAGLVLALTDRPPPEGEPLEGSPPIRWIDVGSPCANAGLVDLDARRLRDDAFEYSIVVLDVTEERWVAPLVLLVDGREAGRRTVESRPGGARLVRLEGPPGETVEIRLERPDALAADNVAWLARATRDRVRVAWSGRTHEALAKALRIQPGVEIAYGGRGEDSDLRVVIGLPPDEPRPGVETLVVDPPVDWPPLRLGERYRPGRLRAVDGDDMEGVELSAVRVDEARIVEGPAGTAVLAVAEGPGGEVPLVVRADRVTLLPFSLEASDWIDWPSFPVFVHHVVRRASAGSPPGIAFHRLGDAVVLPGPGAILAPDGGRRVFEGPGPHRYSPDVAGIHRWTAAGGKLESALAFSLLCEDETRCSGEGSPPRSETLPLPAARPRGNETPMARWALGAAAVALALFYAAPRARPGRKLRRP